MDRVLKSGGGTVKQNVMRNRQAYAMSLLLSLAVMALTVVEGYRNDELPLLYWLLGEVAVIAAIAWGYGRYVRRTGY